MFEGYEDGIGMSRRFRHILSCLSERYADRGDEQEDFLDTLNRLDHGS